MKTTQLSILLLASGFSLPSFANSFVDDSSIKLTTRNFYLHRDFTDFEPMPGAKDWAQGFIFSASSGYTPGTLGFGLDLHSLTSVKLKADAKYLPSGLLPTDAQTRERSDTATEIGITAKAKYHNTELKVGTLQPWTPVIFSSPSRLLPQTFRGAMLNSKEISDLNLTAGYIDKVNHRDSTNYESMTNIGFNQRFKVAEIDDFSFIGGEYKWSPQTQVGLYYAHADDVYQQSALTFKNTTPLTEQAKLTTDIRVWHSDDSGQALAGKVDNTLSTANLGLSLDNHRLTLSGMHNHGQTAHPYLSGGEVLIFIDGWSTDFLNPKERVYGLRYDYDFKDFVPGLKFMTRYTRGNHIQLPNLGGDKLKEDSLDFDLQYSLQTGVLKGLGLRARYAKYDNNFAQNASFKPANETRFNVDYTWTFK